MKRTGPFSLTFLAIWAHFHAACAAPLPELRDGDLVFQTSASRQSVAIFAATGSPYTHMGMVRFRGSRPFVVEAAGPVREMPLADFVARGKDGRIAVYRHRMIVPTQVAKVLAAAEVYYGRGYDQFFAFDNREIYCSELPFLAFAAAGFHIGQVQRVSELKVGTAAVGGLIRERWRDHPACAGSATLDDCLPIILDQQLITPASIAADSAFEMIHSDWR